MCWRPSEMMVMAVQSYTVAASIPFSLCCVELLRFHNTSDHLPCFTTRAHPSLTVHPPKQYKDIRRRPQPSRDDTLSLDSIWGERNYLNATSVRLSQKATKFHTCYGRVDRIKGFLYQLYLFLCVCVECFYFFVGWVWHITWKATDGAGRVKY